MLPANKTTAQYTATDVSNLKPGDLSYISPLDFSKIPASTLAALSYDALSALSAGHIRSLTVNQIDALSSQGLISDLASVQFQALTATQLRALDIPQLRDLSFDQISALTGPQLAALSPHQLREMLYDTGPYINFEKVNAISPAEIKFLTPEQLTGLAEYGLSASLSIEQLNALTPTQVSKLTPLFFDTLGGISDLAPIQISALTPTQVANMPEMFFDKLSDQQFSYFSAAQFSLTDSLKLAKLLADTADILSDTQEAALSKITAGSTVISLTNSNLTGSAITIADGGGVDTIDASSLSARVFVNMNDGTNSSILLNSKAPTSLTIEKGTIIENIKGGSGSDIFLGNQANNTVFGNNGNDNLTASKGLDIFNGGSGADRLMINASTLYLGTGLKINKEIPGTVILQDKLGEAQLQINKTYDGYVVTGLDADFDIGTTFLTNVEQISLVGLASSQHLTLDTLFA